MGLKMGECFFAAHGRRFSGLFTGLLFMVPALAMIIYIINHHNDFTFNAFAFIFIPSFICVWYGLDRLANAFVNKIVFYEKGMTIVKGFYKYKILMNDIKNVRISEKSGSSRLLVFIFELKSNKVIEINSNDYANFADIMREYGKKFNLDWSFK